MEAWKMATLRNGNMNVAGLVTGFIAITGLLLSPLSVAAEDEAHGESSQESAGGFNFDTYRTWLFRSFPPNEQDDNTTLGLEFVSDWTWGDYAWTNIAYIEVADYETPVPGMPIGNPDAGSVPDTGINDLLTAFLISKRGEHHGRHHFSYGFAAQLPTGSGDTLSSGKYAIGPAIDYEYSGERLYMAFVALQLWSVAGDKDRKDINMMMIKPMITWDLNPKWKAVYMPYGVSVYWNKPSGQRVYFPVGGGIQRQFNIGERASAFSLQYFYNVLRPDDGIKQDLRLMLEINF
jgi:hypothetical protein